MNDILDFNILWNIQLQFDLNELEVGGIFLISPLIGTVSSLFISRLMDKKVDNSKFDIHVLCF